MSLSYLASPYNHPDREVMNLRIKLACKAASNLITRGEFVFSPIAHNVTIIENGSMKTGWDTWSEFDLCMLQRCDRLLVLMLEGWKLSKGVSAEIAAAQKLGIPVTYIAP